MVFAWRTQADRLSTRKVLRLQASEFLEICRPYDLATNLMTSNSDQWEQGFCSSSIRFVVGVAWISTKVPHRLIQNFGWAGAAGTDVGEGETNAGRLIWTSTTVREGAGR